MDAATALVRRRRDELVRRARRARGAGEVFAVASARLRAIVPFDAAAWVATDPTTGLPAGPSRIEDLEGVTPGLCADHWRHEAVDEDVHRFRDLARAPVPAGGLRDALGDPTSSPRFRAFLQPLGLEDELRVVLRAGAAPWGTVSLWRRPGHPPFDRRETELVAGLSRPLGDALRAHARHGPAARDEAGTGDGRPGLLLFEPDGVLVSADDAARAWLDELPPGQAVAAGSVDVPLWLLVTVFRAAGAVARGGAGTATARTRTRRGRWLVCHCSCLRGPAGGAGHVAAVLDPASPGEVAPIVVAAHGLTTREAEVAALVARGAGTAEIARRVHLSPHTVRDHVKAILRKVGVSSRGELVATLFAEHYEPRHLRAALHVDTSADPDGAPR